MILQYSKTLGHIYPNILGIKMQFYQKYLYENFELRIIIMYEFRAIALAYIFFFYQKWRGH